MNDPRHQLITAVQELICSYIRAGGFANVAAEAAGVPVKVFERWMAWGQATRPVALYRDFYLAVRQAEAQARLAAESRTFQKAAVSWLRSGPGRATAQAPGWTSPVKALPLTEARQAVSSEELFAMCTTILEASTPFPEARAALAEKLAEDGWDKDPAAEAMAESVAEMPAAESAATRETEERGVPMEKAGGAEPVRADDERRRATVAAGESRGCETKGAAVPAGSQRAFCGRSEGGVNLHRNRIEALLKPQGNEAEAAGKRPGEQGETAEKQRKRGLSPWDSLEAGHWAVGYG